MRPKQEWIKKSICDEAFLQVSSLRNWMRSSRDVAQHLDAEMIPPQSEEACPKVAFVEDRSQKNRDLAQGSWHLELLGFILLAFGCRTLFNFIK